MPLRISFELSTVPVSLGYNQNEDTFFIAGMAATSNTEKGTKFFSELKAAVEADPELASTLPKYPSFPFDGMNSPEVLRRIEISAWGDNGIVEEGYIHIALQKAAPFYTGRVKKLKVTRSPA